MYVLESLCCADISLIEEKGKIYKSATSYERIYMCMFQKFTLFYIKTFLFALKFRNYIVQQIKPMIVYNALLTKMV